MDPPLSKQVAVCKTPTKRVSSAVLAAFCLVRTSGRHVDVYRARSLVPAGPLVLQGYYPDVRPKVIGHRVYAGVHATSNSLA